MIYYFGDGHFGHKNVIRHDSRPFRDIEENDRVLISNWNSVVTDKDDVYIVGDLFFRNDYDAEMILQKLKGRKHLIIGNHDKTWLNNDKIKEYFVEIADIIKVIDRGRLVIICHYPLAEWDGYYRGTYHVYAHIHNNINEAYYIMRTKERALNSGCMINNYMPVTLDEMIINNKIFHESNKN